MPARGGYPFDFPNAIPVALQNGDVGVLASGYQADRTFSRP